MRILNSDGGSGPWIQGGALSLDFLFLRTDVSILYSRLTLDTFLLVIG